MEVSFKVTQLKLNDHKEQRNISSVTSLNTVPNPNWCQLHDIKQLFPEMPVQSQSCNSFNTTQSFSAFPIRSWHRLHEAHQGSRCESDTSCKSILFLITLWTTQRRQKNSRDSAILTSLAAKTMVVNWERSPHSAKNVNVKAWTKIGEIKCSHFFWGIVVPGPDSTSPGPFKSFVLWSCRGQGNTQEITIKLKMSSKQPKRNTRKYS